MRTYSLLKKKFTITIVKQYIPGIIIIVFGFIFFVIAFCNHYFFRTATFDYGNYNFSFWDFAHFKISDCPAFGPHENYLQDHISFTLMIFIPLYWLFAWLFGTYTLAFVQVIIVLIGAWAVYKLIEFKTGNSLSSTFALLMYFLLFGRWSSFATPINFAIVASCFVPLFLYYFEKNKILSAFLCLAFILLTREDMALWTMFIGIFLLIMHFKNSKLRIYAIIVIIISIAYFIFLFTVVTSLIESPYRKYNLFNYSSLGLDPAQALRFIITHPLKSFELLFINQTGNSVYNGIKFEFYYVYFLCGGFLLFWRPVYFLLFIPLIAKKMFNDYPYRWGIENYYSIEIVSILPIAAAIIISEIRNTKLMKVLVIAILAVSASITIWKIDQSAIYYFETHKNSAFYRPSMYKASFDVSKVYSYLKTIPADAKISSCSSINPHMAFRFINYAFPRVDDADYIILFPTWDLYPLNRPQFDKELLRYFRSGRWNMIVNDPPLLILKRKNNSYK